MTARDPLYVPDVTSPTDARLAQSGFIAAGAGGIDVTTGVMYGPSAANISGTSSMAYSVSGFVAVGSKGSSVGPYVGANDGTETVTTTAAPGTGSRYDIICYQFNDVEQGDADSHTGLIVVQGTASGSPSEPATPTGAVRLGKALVPAGATRTDTGVTITKDVRYTAARGAPVYRRNQIERDELTGYDGLVVRRFDQRLDNIWWDGDWNLFGAVTVFGQSSPLKIKTGSTVDTTNGSGNITIATGLTSLQMFIAMNGDAAAHDDLVWARVGSYSGGNVTIKATKSTTGAAITSSSVRYDWLALGSQ